MLPSLTKTVCNTFLYPQCIRYNTIFSYQYYIPYSLWYNTEQYSIQYNIILPELPSMHCWFTRMLMYSMQFCRVEHNVFIMPLVYIGSCRLYAFNMTYYDFKFILNHECITCFPPMSSIKSQDHSSLVSLFDCNCCCHKQIQKQSQLFPTDRKSVV